MKGPDLFSWREQQRPHDPPEAAPGKPPLHSRYRVILREMHKTGSQIVEFPIEYKGMKRIRLAHWPRQQGMSEKGLRALVDGGYVRQLRLHRGSKAYPRYVLTPEGVALCEA